MENPYDKFIKSCVDVREIQNRYEQHRRSRNAQQRAKLLSPALKALEPDPILKAILRQDAESPFADLRHNLVFWARPSSEIRNLIDQVQQKLLSEAPNLWLMPLDCLHMTVLEITHSTTAPVLDDLLKILQPGLQDIVDYPSQHPTRLIKPMLGFDASALALTFVPAAGEGARSENMSQGATDSYSYHHLRRDMYDLNRRTGVEIASRYTVLSAHLTVARFTSETSFATKAKESSNIEPSLIKGWLSCVDEVNAWLEADFWPEDNEHSKSGGEWIVGQERGLECRKGICWYGGGETAAFGKASK